MKYNFQDKVALVTGGASGIGRETCLQFAQNGAKVVVSDVNEQGGEETVQMIQKENGKAIFCSTNVAQFEEIEKLITKTLSAFGRLDFGINNAGIGGSFTPTANYTVEEYRQVMAINVDGVFYGMKLQIPEMLKQGGGAIVNTASIAGLRGLKNSSPYSASKHAVIGLTKSAALEYASKNIRVNAVCPVFTRTPLFDAMFDIDPSYEEKLRSNIPMKRYGTVADIAKTILWLCSEEASFITGQAYALDGGLTAG